MSKFQDILGQLNKVRSRSNGNYLACCPAHDDKNPSLSLCELPDGRILLKCWAGCEIDSIVAALGYRLSDLFPDLDSRQRYIGFKSLETRSGGQTNSKLENEKRILNICKNRRQQGDRLKPGDLERERQAYIYVRQHEQSNR